MTRVIALIATIPTRRASCERLLAELTAQSRPPDGVILCLDGYGDDLPPACPLPLFIVRRQELSGGPGHKWGTVEKMVATRALLVMAPRCETLRMSPDGILVCIDDDADLSEAPHFIESLAHAVSAPAECRFQERFGQVAVQLVAAAAMGYTPDGHRAGPGDTSRGPLVLGCGCGLAVRAGYLQGLQAFAAEVLAAGGPDALGPCGDDQALVSAYLWRQGILIRHAPTGPIHFAPGTHQSSQDAARKAKGEVTRREQAHAIARITGWPFPAEEEIARHNKPQRVQSIDVPDGDPLPAVPPGAVRVQGGEPVPPGWTRRLVVDEGEPERSGVYDVPA